MTPEEEVDALLKAMDPLFEGIRTEIEDLDANFYGAEGFGEAWPC